MSDWLLYYWIRGKNVDSWRTINVSPETTVDELKDCIIKRDALSLTPSLLHVYKVPDDHPVLDDDSIGDILGTFSISMLGKPLRATRTLSTYFKSIPQGQLHLIIDVPTLVVQCWLQGVDRGSSFAVTVSGFEIIDLFKSAIKAEQQATLADVPVHFLKLYKISTSGDDLPEILGATGTGQLLDGGQLLGTAFNDVPFSEQPGVVIQWRDESVTKPPPSAYRSVANGDPIASARIKFLSHAPKDMPSSSGTLSSFRTRQGGRKFIPCGRPRDHERNNEETIPPTLLHPVFGQFVDDCQSIEITAEDNRLAQDLEIAMSNLYKNEAERVEGVNDVLKHYQIHFTISKIQKTDYLVDGDMSVDAHRYVIAEFKNEAGSTSAEPYFEAIAYYLESTRELAPKHLRSPLPCLLLAIFGPHIVFAGAAWNLRPTIQVLSTPIAFHFHSTDTQSQLTVARHMAAFRRAINTLEAYYRNLRATPLPTTIPPVDQIFPYPTTYESVPDKTTKQFWYKKAVVEEKLIFFATDENDHEICVKFARTYSIDAHHCLASLGCAPVLRGHEKIPGGWHMVVFDALCEFETLDARKKHLPSSVFKDMSEKLGMFHKAGFVHGDIRDVNIMVSKTDEHKFMFIDFDWSGEIGKARYPARVNTTTITRPPDVLDGNPIKEEHDLDMLDYIRRSMCKD